MTMPDRMAAAAVSLSAAIPALFANDITTPVIGVGVSTIAGAVLGTYAAIGYDEDPKPRGKLFTLATATVIIASAATGVIPQAAGWHWTNSGVEGGAAALWAVLCYYGLPEAIPTTRRLIRNFKWSDLPFIRKAVASRGPAAGDGNEGDPRA